LESLQKKRLKMYGLLYQMVIPDQPLINGKTNSNHSPLERVPIETLIFIKM
jgi:hypothetical protein